MNSRSSDRRPPTRLIRNEDDIPSSFRDEVVSCAHRAVAAGAKMPLTFVGIGMTGVVLTDRFKNMAYKVARHDTDMVVEEAEWFAAARKVPAMKGMVPGKVRWDADNRVLIRPYVKGRPGAWGDASKLYDQHAEIEKVMIPYGWTAPERKEGSYVVSGGSWRGGDFDRAVLVDASMAQRVGKELVRYALDVASGKRKPARGERLSDLAYYVYRERMVPSNRNGTIPVDDVRRVLAALRAAGGVFEWEV